MWSASFFKCRTSPGDRILTDLTLVALRETDFSSVQRKMVPDYPLVQVAVSWSTELPITGRTCHLAGIPNRTEIRLDSLTSYHFLIL